MSISWSVIWLPLVVFILPVPMPPGAVHVACCGNHRWYSGQSSNLGRLVIHSWLEQGITHLHYFCSVNPSSPHVRESGNRNPESGKILLMESGILEFGIQNKAHGIRNPSNDLESGAQLFEGQLAINPGFSFLRWKAFSWIIFSFIFRASNHQLVDKKN